MFSLRLVKLAAMEKLLASMQRAAGRRAAETAVPRHLILGERGEQAALFHLRREGYVVVARRWTSPKQRGDLDLVAWEGDTLCFVEVKTRGSFAVASAESAVDEDKRQTLRRLARIYLKAVEPPPAQVRFDLISVYALSGQPELHLYRGAFDW